MKATHAIVFAGGFFVAAVKIGEDIKEAIMEEVAEDEAEGYSKSGDEIDAYVSHIDVSLSNDEFGGAVYHSGAFGWLSDDDDGVPYGYAYRADS